MFASIWNFFSRDKDPPEIRKRGRRGEALALKYLSERGLQIAEKNWRCSFGELDIIAQSGEILVVIEVKSAGKESIFRPEFRVNKRKRDRIKRLTRAYLKSHRIDSPVRYDVVTVVWSTTGVKIEHIENAFS